MDARIGPPDAGRATVRAAPRRSRWWRRQPGAAPRIAGLYAAIGFAWIAFSDRLVAKLSSDAAVHDALQTAKGSFYVLVTAALLFVLILRSERRVRALGAEVRATVYSMADGVLLVDERSRIVEANAAAIVLLGAPSKEEILDMRMPGMNGWEFAREFRRRYGRSVPIVVVTAAENARARAEEIEADGWLAKPFDLDDVVAAAARHAGRPAAHGSPAAR